MKYVMTRSILHGYLIQCNDEPGNPINDCESGSKWGRVGSSLKGICVHKKSASEETPEYDSSLENLSLQPDIAAPVTLEDALADHIPADGAVIRIDGRNDFVDFFFLIHPSKLEMLCD